MNGRASQPLALRSLQPSVSGSNIAGKQQKKLKTLLAENANPKLKPANSYSKIVNFFQKKPKSSSECSEENLTYSEGTQTDESLKTSIDVCDVAEQTEVSISPVAPVDTENEIRGFMLSATPTARYWQLLAEERGKQLQEQADDNMQMAIDISNLKEENRELRQLAEEGQHFADILKEMLAEQGNDDGNSKAPPHSTTAESGFLDETTKSNE